MKKYICIILLAVITVIAPIQVLANPESVNYPIVRVKVNGACNDQICGEGFNIDGTTYVPVRLVLETMGASVQWNQEEQSVQIIKTNHSNMTADNQNQDQVNETVQLISDIEVLIDRALLLERQVDVAADIYNHTKETQWLSEISKGKLAELKMEISKQTDIVIKYQKKYEELVPKVKELTEIIHHIDEIASYLGLAIQSFENYNSSSVTNDYKMYLVYRKLALDTIEISVDGLNDLKQDINS